MVTRDLPDASGTPSGRLWGGSWGRLWLILAHLGGVLGAQDGPKILPRRPKMPLRCLQDSPRSDFQQKKSEKMSPWSSDGIFHSILVRFYFKNTSPNFEKSLKLYWKNRQFWLSGCLNIRYLRNAILVPTWLHVGANMGPCWRKKTS